MNAQEYLRSRRIYLRGDIDSDMLEAFDKQQDDFLRDQPELDTPLVIVLTSPGGHTVIARALYERIRLLAGLVPVNIIVIGECSSSAVTVYCAVSREHRFATPDAHFYVHELSRTQFEIGEGTVRQWGYGVERSQKQYQWMRIDYDWMIGVMAKACGRSKKSIRAECNKSCDMIAKEALARGYVGTILQPEARPATS